MEIKCEQVATLTGGKWDKMLDINKRVYSINGCAPTINTCEGGHREPKIAVREGTKKGYAVAEEGDSINLAFPNSTTRRGRVGKQMAQTIDCGCEQAVVVSTRGNEEIKCKHIAQLEGHRFYEQAFETVKENDCESGDTIDAFNKKVNKSGVSPTVTTRPEGFKTAILVVDEPLVWDGFNQQVRAEKGVIGTITQNVGADLKRNGQGIIEPVAYDEQNGYIRQDGTVGTLTTDGSSPKHNNRIIEPCFRVRKLTPKECWRLMGFADEDVDKAKEKASNSQLYKQAGNSIVVDVLMAIFKNLLGETK